MNKLNKKMLVTVALVLFLQTACKDESHEMTKRPSSPPESILSPAEISAIADEFPAPPETGGKIDVTPATSVSIGANDSTPNTVPEVNGERYFHWCQNNDSLKSIADKYQIDINRIASLNGLHASSPLKKGRIILIPKDFSDVANGADITTYTIASGDTYARIARGLNMSPGALMKLNRANNSSLQIGNTIYVPKK